MRVRARYEDGTWSQWEVPLPPSALADTTASTLFAAAQSRLTKFVMDAGRHVHVLNSDRAKSCLKVASHHSAKAVAGDAPPSLHGPCMMHMMFASFVASIAPFDAVPALFCGTLLMRRAHNIRKLTGSLRQRLRGKVRRVFEPPLETSQFNKAVIGFLQLAERHHYEWEGSVGQQSKGLTPGLELAVKSTEIELVWDWQMND